MSRFGSEPQEFFKAVYAEQAPWDIGAPQPALMDLVHEFPPASPILDVGCGSGDLAIALAREAATTCSPSLPSSRSRTGRAR